jgi:uncharacterized protein YcbX
MQSATGTFVRMRVSSIHTYPVKGCHRVDHDLATVEPWGLASDRRWLVVDEEGRLLTQREEPGLTRIHPDGGGSLTLRSPGRPELRLAAPSGDLSEVRVHRDPVLATPAGDVADTWLSAVLDRKVHLMYLDDPARRPVDPTYGLPGDRVSFADAYPLLLTTSASLDALNDWIVEGDSGEGPLPMARFRPNLVVSDAPAWVEDGWLGRRIRVGSVPFRAPKLCDRCVVTTTDQETGERGHEPLRTLTRYRRWDQKVWFGMNLIPDGTGDIHVGDDVTVID